jgi:hypothetical protein
LLEWLVNALRYAAKVDGHLVTQQRLALFPRVTLFRRPASNAVAPSPNPDNIAVWGEAFAFPRCNEACDRYGSGQRAS